MKTYLAAAAIAAALTQPAAAITFPSLTTIYVASGAFDNGQPDTGTYTLITCSNVSGLTANLRILVLDFTGDILGVATVSNVGNGRARIIGTKQLSHLNAINLNTGGFVGGTINIESTQSGVFCTAIVGAVGAYENAFPLHLVRVNPHPGTVE